MIFDILFFIIILYGFYMGYKKGLIYSIFGFFALFISITLALKFGFLAAEVLNERFEIQASYLPFLGFLVIFLITLVLVYALSKIIEGFINLVFLGWLNRLTGGFLWAVILLFVYSAVLWMTNQAGFISADWKINSKTVGSSLEFAPKLMGIFGEVFPFMKSLFSDIEQLIIDFASNKNNNL
ncbi:MAG: CvpA family protein [Chitinophagaceae bacterium]|nr:MAG: CvpA family protein [Chitinophagaceae bacterium]